MVLKWKKEVLKIGILRMKLQSYFLWYLAQPFTCKHKSFMIKLGVLEAIDSIISSRVYDHSKRVIFSAMLAKNFRVS